MCNYFATQLFFYALIVERDGSAVAVAFAVVVFFFIFGWVKLITLRMSHRHGKARELLIHWKSNLFVEKIHEESDCTSSLNGLKNTITQRITAPYTAAYTCTYCTISSCCES